MELIIPFGWDNDFQVSRAPAVDLARVMSLPLRQFFLRASGRKLEQKGQSGPISDHDGAALKWAKIYNLAQFPTLTAQR